MAVNQYVGAGNLVRDAETYQTKSGGYAISFTVAITNRRRNQQTGEYEDDPVFLDCVLYDSKGGLQWMVPHLSKGFRVTVSGNLRMDRWQDKDTNQNRSKIVLVVRDVDATWPPRDAAPQQQNQQPQYQQPQYQQPQYGQQYQPTQHAQRPAQQQATFDQRPAQGMYDEDIPF
jgi:single-strand DNA-binding protein